MSGPRSTRRKKAFTVDEVCRILEVCARQGVRSLKLGDAISVELGAPVPGSPSDDPAPATSQDDQGPQVTEQAVLEEEARAADEDADNLIVSDPAAYEAALSRGALTDADEDDQ
jgi:hypothetical protein